MITEMWEDDHGAAVSFIFNPIRKASEFIKIEVMDENDNEVQLELSIGAFKRLLKAGIRFDEQLSETPQARDLGE